MSAVKRPQDTAATRLSRHVTPSLERLEAARTAEALDPRGAPRRRATSRRGSRRDRW